MTTKQSKPATVSLSQLEADYKQALADGETTFFCEGQLISTAFAPYMISYIKLQLKRRKANN